ncbi:hypothetical protein WT27_13630 [Burkholderia territorii]|uniref:Phosphoadenosine phosphosulphate reductase domain-containing protein n=1 Tax=Burkholderia territorii TaxID=1503055 RepID=A0A119APD3_9BURK|nr:phosphoadenosine phosphosulfate reductase family protein [Burkholderia territorii]KVV40958.1 hypothetical protein WT27_13630 [Burkholderia territorii]KVX33907.1 hypothetical protein WT31_09540 [Burkholderia territorii]
MEQSEEQAIAFDAGAMELRNLEENALRAIDALLEANVNPCCGYSAGKDSTTVANLMLTAARKRIEAGKTCPTLYLLHADTGVENSAMVELARSEMRKIQAYAKKHGFSVKVLISEPALNEGFATRVFSGRALPSFPESNRDCSTSWKILPMNRLRRKLLKSAREGSFSPTILIGTRQSESVARAVATAARGESDTEVWRAPDGHRMLSPILRWADSDVWEYLGYVHAGVIDGFSDMTDIMRIYRDAGNSSCYVVGDMALDESRKAGGCGARTGCHVCVRIKSDKSMLNMLEEESGRYAYMKPLSAFREFLVATQYDWSRRNWIGRTVDSDGYVAIRPDTYSPQMLEELLKYALSIQADEFMSARKLGIKPRFSYVNRAQLYLIDAIWSLQGLHMPFHAHVIEREIAAGARFCPPALAKFEKTPTPAARWIYVGRSWDDVTSEYFSAGLRDPILEMHGEQCEVDLRQLKDGRIVMDYDAAPAIDFDEDGMELFDEFELDRHIERYHRPDVDWTIGYRTYLRYGFMSPAASSAGDIDMILRRTHWKQQHDLHGQQDIACLLRRSVAKKGEVSNAERTVDPSQYVQEPLFTAV